MKQSKTTHKQKQGFSLIELLVVMAIIAILMGIVIGVSGSIQRKAGEAKARAELADIMTEIELYKADVGQYPLSVTLSGRDVLVLRNPDDPKGFMDWYEAKYPDTLFTTIDIGSIGGNEVFIDPWGEEIVYKYDPSNPFVYLIGSTGPNGVNGTGSNPHKEFGDGDDITNRNGAL